ncbi:MAG: hypothetical protein GZ093_09035 [Rhodoferax sp.]|uniref:hypothetical protein n=1 Tax=Rhodoferax sp. TaxID=50421 RepID=UPI0013FFE84C|nr:hypothetical protein [Rhodoferax sp.]NDP38878.1 hypothetical protein [Rhodoferax sp.]
MRSLVCPQHRVDSIWHALAVSFALPQAVGVECLPGIAGGMSLGGYCLQRPEASCP